MSLFQIVVEGKLKSDVRPISGSTVIGCMIFVLIYDMKIELIAFKSIATTEIFTKLTAP